MLRISILKVLIIIIITFLFNSNIHSQNWTIMMQDSSYTLEQKSKSFNDYWKDKTYEKGKGYKQFKRWEQFMKFRMDDKNKFNPSSDRVSDYQAIQRQINNSKSIGYAGRWEQLGPMGPSNGTGSGRTNTIDFHPTNNDIILVGAPSGGIWRSTDGGDSWSTNTDDLASIGISDIQFAPSNGNIVYAATGDRDGADTYTHGILKSTDAGKHWTTTSWAYNYHNKKQTYKIIVNPNDEDIVYASTSNGLYKTSDGGANWDKIKLGTFKDIAFKPDDANTIYIATSKYIYKSTNAGSSFTKLSFVASSPTNRLEIATTAADPDYLYVLGSKSSDNGFGGIYLSTDAGSSFTTKATSPNLLGWKTNGADQGGQGWYDLSLTVSPTDKTVVFVGGVNIWKSTNSGASWSINAHWTGAGGNPYVHADIHMLKYNTNTGNLWACTDGGLSKTSNNGNTWVEKNNKLSIAQMYRLGSSKNVSTKVMTGWQDNGSSFYNNSWNYVLGGDGMECIISNSNNSVIYASLYNGKIYRSYNSGQNWSEISQSITETGAWTTPYIQHPTNSSLLYAGYINVWRTSNGGNTWTKISNMSSSHMNALASAPSNSQIIWAANDYKLYKTTDGGQNWTTINSNIGSGQVTSIAINKSNPNIVWISKSGFYNNKKVYETRDGGNSWVNISDSLPNYPVNTIVNAENTAHALYVGTDIGVYYRDTILGHWIPFMKGLPNVIVSELEIFSYGNKIRAATYGRGLWESDLYPLANSINKNSISNFDINVYPNPAKDIIYIKIFNEGQQRLQLSVYNSIGTKIYSKTILNNKEISINTSNFAKGIYYIRLTSNSYTSINKVIIE
jgi:photosystem II stability/assembly factor-like uncharacterized protein